MKGLQFCLALSALAFALPAQAQVGFAFNANFYVTASADQRTADEIIARAEHFRRQLAVEWLGRELPAGVGPVAITASISPRQSGLTWIVDCPERRWHKVWIGGEKEFLLSHGLCHELAHCVLATEFADRLPPWSVEGAASRYDDAERGQTCDRVIAAMARSGRWPPLGQLLAVKTIAAEDQQSYAMARSLADYLLTRGDRATYLRFALDGASAGWDAACARHYRMSSLEALEASWHAWAGQPRSGVGAR